MSNSEYCEHESENSFDENEDNEIENRDELFKGLGLEPYQFEPTKKLWNITGREQLDSEGKHLSD